MVTVKVKTVHKATEVFITEKYLICSKKEMHPDILSVDVYAEGKKICHIARHFKWFYKKYFYKPLPTEPATEEPVAEKVETPVVEEVKKPTKKKTTKRKTKKEC